MKTLQASIAARLLALYPREWRERYEEEFHAVLEECSLSLLLVMDIIWGAVDAHLNYQRAARRLAARRRFRRRRTAFIVACTLLWASGGTLAAIGPFRPGRALLQ